MELKTDRMTHQERMQALYSYQKPDRVPILQLADKFAMINAGCTLTELHTEPQKALDAWLSTCQQYGWEPEPPHHPWIVLGSWNFGAKVRMPDSPYAMSVAVEEYPVKTEEDVLNLKLPDPKTAGNIPKRFEYARLQEKAGMMVTFRMNSPFNTASDICGAEQFCRWLLKKPEICTRLLELALTHLGEVLKYWAQNFGASRVFCCVGSPSESNQVISPRHFKEYALPYHRKFHKMLRDIGIKRFFFHICGEQNLNLPHLAEFASSADSWPHPTILSFGHEVDLEAAAHYFPQDIIMGNIEPAVIQEGSPEQIYELCKVAIEKGKKIPGGFILGPGCDVPPRAPAANIQMMTKAVSDFGWYV